MDEHTHMVVDCVSGTVEHIPLTAEEIAARDQRAAQAAAEAAAEAQVRQQRAADLAAVQAYAASNPDPHWQALARLVGAL